MRKDEVKHKEYMEKLERENKEHKDEREQECKDRLAMEEKNHQEREREKIEKYERKRKEDAECDRADHQKLLKQMDEIVNGTPKPITITKCRIISPPKSSISELSSSSPK